jgi:hypothetical protein
MASGPAPGSPIPPSGFRGREKAITEVAQRLLDPERLSTSIVGGPKTGKTSLLRYLASPAADPRLPGLDYRVYFDVQVLSAKSSPKDFWVGVLRELKNHHRPPPAGIPAVIDQKLVQAQIDGYDLEDVFDGFGKSGSTVVLLVDNFELLLSNSSYWGDFFHMIRALGQRHPRGLAWVIGTPRLLLDLWSDHLGSVYYNIFATITMGSLSEDEVRAFIRRDLAPLNLASTADAEDLVLAASDGHPYLVQVVTSLILKEGKVPDSSVIRAAVRDPNGDFVSLAHQIRATLTPSERLWLETLRTAPDQLTDFQRRSLARLKDYRLLPPGTRL